MSVAQLKNTQPIAQPLFDRVMGQAPKVAANSDKILRVARPVVNETALAGAEKFGLRGIFAWLGILANPVVDAMVLVGGLCPGDTPIHDEPEAAAAIPAIDKPPPTSSISQWLAEIEELGNMMQLLAQTRMLMELYKMYGLTSLADQARRELEDIYIQMSTISAGYAVMGNALKIKAQASAAASDIDPDIAAGLKSKDVNKQCEAWLKLHYENPEAARRITEADMGPGWPIETGRRGGRHATFYVRPAFTANSTFQLLRDHYWGPQYKPAEIDLRDNNVHPANSLDEFSPHTGVWKYNSREPIDRRSYRRQYMERLKRLVAQGGNEDPQAVLEAFTGERVEMRDDMEQSIRVLQFPSGKIIIVDGMHRIAALIQVVREERLDPETWLGHVPAQLWSIDEDSPIPEHLAVRFLAPANELTLGELLPPKRTPRSYKQRSLESIDELRARIKAMSPDDKIAAIELLMEETDVVIQGLRKDAQHAVEGDGKFETILQDYADFRVWYDAIKEEAESNLPPGYNSAAKMLLSSLDVVPNSFRVGLQGVMQEPHSSSHVWQHSRAAMTFFANEERKFYTKADVVSVKGESLKELSGYLFQHLTHGGTDPHWEIDDWVVTMPLKHRPGFYFLDAPWPPNSEHIIYKAALETLGWTMSSEVQGDNVIVRLNFGAGRE